MRVNDAWKLRLSLVLLAVVLFPFAMSSKFVTIIVYIAGLLIAAVFAVKQTKRWWRVLILTGVLFLLTFIIPVDFALKESSSFGLVTRDARFPDGREPDTTLGVQARWIFEFQVPTL